MKAEPKRWVLCLALRYGSSQGEGAGQVRAHQRSRNRGWESNLEIKPGNQAREPRLGTEPGRGRKICIQPQALFATLS